MEEYKIYEYALSDAWGNDKYRVALINKVENNLVMRKDVNQIFGDEKRYEYTLEKDVVNQIKNLILNNSEIFDSIIERNSLKEEELLTEVYFSNGEKTKLFRIANLDGYRKNININQDIKLFIDIFDNINNLINDNID